MTADAHARWRRLDPDERRDEILASAIRLFGERPYSAVSTTELAAAAGVTRGLLHHYFGTKRGLYLEVVRTMMFVPPIDEVHLPTGSTRERVDAAIEWMVKVIEAHGRTWVAVAGAEGVGSDPEVQRILDEADDLAAERLLDAVGFAGSDDRRAKAFASIRAFGGMVKASGRELVDRGSLSRDEVGALLGAVLLALLDHVEKA